MRMINFISSRTGKKRDLLKMLNNLLEDLKNHLVLKPRPFVPFSTMNNKSLNPNLIDLYNVETTNKLIPQSFQYVLKTLLTKYYSNKYLMNVYNNFDDYSFTLNFIINYLSLSKTDSTFIGNNFNISYEYNDKYVSKNDLILITLFDNFGIDYIATKLDNHKNNLFQKYKLIKKNYKKKLTEEEGKLWEDHIDDFKDHVKKNINLNHYTFMFKY